MQKMIVWALFDSGNGSYTKAINTLNSSGGANIEVYPIGIDIENKNNHFIPLNLADYSRLFGDNTLFDELDKLPKPDLIIASPPCESWSNASSMGGMEMLVGRKKTSQIASLFHKFNHLHLLLEVIQITNHRISITITRGNF